MSYDPDHLAARIKRQRMRAERGDHDLNPDTRPEGLLKPAAVLVPVVTRVDLSVVLTRRTDHLAHHPGQISFPGGHVDSDDATVEDAALREAEEEVGLPTDQVTVLGTLNPYITRTGFDITPVVGLVDPAFEPRPDPHEVAEVFEVPLAFLMDPANRERHTRAFEGRERHFFAFSYGEYFIWGATAGMLVNLYEHLSGERIKRG